MPTTTEAPSDALTAAEEYVERYTGVGVSFRTRLHTIYGGLRDYPLPIAPVVSLIEILDIRTDEEVDLPAVTTAGTIYFIDRLPLGAYTVEYNAGYAEGALPPALQTVIDKMTADLAALATLKPFTSEHRKEYGYTIAAEVEAIAAPYKAILDLYVRY